MSRRFRAASVGFALLGASTSGLAQPGAGSEARGQSVALHWAGPGPELDCLGEEQLARAVNDYLGREAFASGSVELVLRVNVERLEDRSWRAVLELRDLSEHVLGKRELTTKDDRCSSLDEPLMLATALMVDSEPEPEPPPTRAKPPPELESEPEGESEPGISDPAPSAPPTPWVFHAVAGLSFELGLLPAARPGWAVALELAPSWWSVRVGGVGFQPASVDVAPGARAEFELLAARLLFCSDVGESGAPRVTLCTGPLVGALRAESTGVAAARSTWRRVLAISFGVSAELPLAERWALAPEAVAVLPYRPEAFTVSEDGRPRELFRASGLSFLATLGASFKF